MKCIKSGVQIKRVSDREAYKLAKAGWGYISKAEWKKSTRGPNYVAPDNSPKPNSKAQKRKNKSKKSMEL